MNSSACYKILRENVHYLGWDLYPVVDLFPASRGKYRILGKKIIPFPLFQIN